MPITWIISSGTASVVKTVQNWAKSYFKGTPWTRRLFCKNKELFDNWFDFDGWYKRNWGNGSSNLSWVLNIPFTSGNNDESSIRIFLERIQFVKVLWNSVGKVFKCNLRSKHGPPRSLRPWTGSNVYIRTNNNLRFILSLVISVVIGKTLSCKNVVHSYYIE